MNLLPFLPMTSEVCDLVSALTETSFLVFQKAVELGELAGLLAAECVDRLVAGAPCQPGGDVPEGSLWHGTLGNRETQRV